MRWRSSRAATVVLVTLATFADIVAYTVCVPVLPDLARRIGASPTVIGLLFGSFGATLLAVSIPMGTISDRTGRKGPLVAGMLALAAATFLFARATSLPLLFAARMVQGAADGVTWGVGFALVADCYGAEDRGRVMGYVMSGTSVGIMAGPSIGGWLYEAGGVAVPFQCVAGLSLLCAVGFVLIQPPARSAPSTPATFWSVVRVPAVAACAAAVVITGSTIAMLEPVLALFLSRTLGLTPTRIGLLFGCAAVALTVMPFVFGPLADKWGGRKLTLGGLLLATAWMPLLATASSFASALAVVVVQWTAWALVVTPSLAYMAEVTASADSDAYGIGYGIYNTAWGVGSLVGPSLGGWLFDRLGFATLVSGWAAGAMLLTVVLGRVRSDRPR